MKCETPARSARSSREPTSIQKPSETERTLATRSEMIALAGVELAQDDLLHGSIVGERSGRAYARATKRSTVPFRFASYSASSARRNSVCGSFASSGHAAEPKLALTFGGPRLTAGRQLLEQRLDPGDDLPRVLLGRLRQQHGELVAADAEGVVGLPQRLGEHVRERDERLVAGRHGRSGR